MYGNLIGTVANPVYRYERRRFRHPDLDEDAGREEMAEEFMIRKEKRRADPSGPALRFPFSIFNFPFKQA